MKRVLAIAEIDGDELACRIAEGALRLQRPAGFTAKASLDAIADESSLDFRRAARMAAEYLTQCLDKGKSVQ